MAVQERGGKSGDDDDNAMEVRLVFVCPDNPMPTLTGQKAWPSILGSWLLAFRPEFRGLGVVFFFSY